jgi:hypothetical protein
MSLMLHKGAQPIDYHGLRDLMTPEPTRTHVPIPHYRLVDLVRHTLGFYGHQVVAEQHGITPDGMRYFGLMNLSSHDGAYEDSVVLRSSHDKSLPVGIGFGGHVFCCDNLSMYADTVVHRRHTARLKADLPGIIMAVVEPLANVRDQQQRVFDRYRATTITPELADHTMLELYRQGVFPSKIIGDVNQEFYDPSFEEMRIQPLNGWRLFNAVTFVLTGKILGSPQTSQTLHRVLDDVCTRYRPALPGRTVVHGHLAPAA